MGSTMSENSKVGNGVELGNPSPVARPTGSTQDQAPLPGLRAWFKAFTAASILAAAGFIAKLAHEQLLGLQLSDWTVLDLSLFAGRWIMDTLTAVLSTIPSFNWWEHLLLVVSLAALSIFVFAPVHHRLMPFFRLGTMLAVVISLITVIARLEMPTLSLNQWITSNIEMLLAPSNSDGHMSARMKGVYFLSKTDYNPTSGDALLKQLGEPDLPREFPGKQSATAQVYKWYCGCFLVVCLGCIACYLFDPGSPVTRIDEVAEFLNYAAIYVLLPISCTLLPYMYGKLIYTSEFPRVTLTLSGQRNAGAAGDSADSGSATSPPGQVSTANNFPRETGILLENSEQYVKLLDVVNKNVRIREFRADEIVAPTLIKTPVDIVEFVLGCKVDPTADCSAVR